MDTFADEIRDLIDKWRDMGTTDEELVGALLDEIDRLDPGDDD